MKRIKEFFITCCILTLLPIKASEMQSKQLIYQRTAHSLFAINRGDLETVRKSMAEGIDANQTDRAGLTMLVYASRHGYADIVKDLIEGGATPSINALNNGLQHPNIVQMLLNAGVNINPKERRVTAPLRLAAQQGNTEMVKMLLKAGADLNAQNEWRNTPLILSLSGTPKIDTAKLLIDVGADVNIVGDRNHTALTYALQNNNMELITLLRKAGAYPTNEDLLAALKKTNNPTNFLLELLNPVPTPDSKEKIKTILLIHQLSESSLSILPKNMLTVIIGYTFPEYSQNVGLSDEELRSVETQILVDRLSLEQLACLIKNGIVDKEAVLKTWQEKIDALYKQLPSNYSVNQQVLLKLKTEVQKQIE